MLAEKKARGTARMNIATEKAKLVRIRDHAQEVGDDEEIERYLQPLHACGGHAHAWVTSTIIAWSHPAIKPVAAGCQASVPKVRRLWGTWKHSALSCVCLNWLLISNVAIIELALSPKTFVWMLLMRVSY